MDLSAKMTQVFISNTRWNDFTRDTFTHDGFKEENFIQRVKHSQSGIIGASSILSTSLASDSSAAALSKNKCKKKLILKLIFLVVMSLITYTPSYATFCH